MPRKPRTKKVITEEIIDTEPEAQTVEPEFIDPDEQLLDSVLGQFGGQSGIKVKLQRITPQGQAEYLQTYPNATAQVAEVDEAFIQRNFGAGRYAMRFYRDAQLVHLYNVTIAADPNAALNITNGRPAGALDPVTAMLLEDRKIMMEALFRKNSDTTPVGELAQAVSVITSVNQAKEALPWEKIFEVFMKGLDFGRSGEAPSEGGWLGFAKDMGRQLAPALLPAVANMLGNGSGNGVTAVPGIPPEAIKMLQMGIGYLKKKALAGKDPAPYVEFVMENRDEEMYANLIGVLCSMDFATLAAIDPQIGQEPYHAFFVGIYNGIRQAVAEEQQEAAGTLPEVNDGAYPAGESEVQYEPIQPQPIDPRPNGAGGHARNPQNHGGARAGRGKE